MSDMMAAKGVLMKLGKWLKKERKRQGMTQTVAAVAAGVMLRTWARWEATDRDWTPAQWRQAACALGKSMREADTVFADLVLARPIAPYPMLFVGKADEASTRGVDATVADITSKGVARSYVSIDDGDSWHLIAVVRIADGGQ